MDVKLFLEDFDKEVSDDALDYIEEMKNTMNLTDSDFCNMILAFMQNNDIYSNKIDINLLERFKTKKIRQDSHLVEKEPIIKIKNKKRSVLKLNVHDFMGDYVGDKENYALSGVNTNNRDVSECKPELISSFNFSGMYQNISQSSNLLKQQSEKILQIKLNLSKSLLNLEVEKLSDMSPVGWFSHDDVYICGQITVDYTKIAPEDMTHFGKSIDKNNYEAVLEEIKNKHKFTLDVLALEGIDAEFLSSKVLLNVEGLSSYSFFPGQNVILKGSSLSKNEFFVKQLISNYSVEAAPIKVDSTFDGAKIIIAAGPFQAEDQFTETTSFNKLFEHAHSNDFQIIVLLGPFVDVNNKKLQEMVGYSHQTLLEKQLTCVSELSRQFQIHVVILPHLDDATEIPVYPQERFQIFDEEIDDNEFLHFVPNPSLMKIGPFIFGFTSVDIVRDMSANEINRNCDRRINRLCSYLLSESNFYPLKCNTGINIDLEAWAKYCQFEEIPHYLILPSKIQSFVEIVNNTVCINPGKMIKEGNINGSYCKLTLQTREKGSTVLVTDVTHCEFQKLD